MLFRRLRGRISVHTSSMYARHSDFCPSFPTALHPAGMALSANQIEYCSSRLITTLYTLVSSSSSAMRYSAARKPIINCVMLRQTFQATVVFEKHVEDW